MTERFPSIPRVIAHRGASAHAPENTLTALREAARRGATWIEVDAKLSKDGVPILFHDDTLERTTNGSGPVADADLAAVQTLDAGSWFGPAFAGEPVPTLSATIRTLAELGLGANIEIKPCPGREFETGVAVAALVANEWPWKRLPPPLLSSFSETALTAARNTATELPRALLVDAVSNWSNTAGYVAIHCNHNGLIPEQVQAVKESGLALRCYTVNDAERAQTLFQWGVDGVFTDNLAAISAKPKPPRPTVT